MTSRRPTPQRLLVISGLSVGHLVPVWIAAMRKLEETA